MNTTKSCRFGRKAAVSLTAAVALTIAATGADAAFKTIHPMAFAPHSTGSGNVADFYNNWKSGSLTGDGCYNAGVDLPDGAQINQLKIYFKSTDDDNVIIVLYATEIATGKLKSIVSESILDDDDVRKPKKFVVSHTVDMKKYMYGIGVCPYFNGVFYGARIKYNPK